jgi:hypothetical protein
MAADARLAERLDAATAAEVERIVDGARARGLPTEPLISKALEGAAKRAPGERIVAVVRAQAEAFGSARSALGDSSSEAEIVAGAAALLADVPGDSLARLRVARPHQSLVIPLVVLSDLVARRVPTGAASSAVLLAARAGARDADLLRLRERVERDIASGASPGGTALLRARSLLIPGGSPRRDSESSPARRSAP